MASESPEAFYVDLQVQGAAFRVRIERELVEDDLGLERVDRATFEDWAAQNLLRVSRAAVAKRLATPARPIGENRILVLGQGDLDRFSGEGATG